MAGVKEGGKEKKSSGKEESMVLLRRLAEEVAALRADVEAVRSPPPVQDGKNYDDGHLDGLLQGENSPLFALARELRERLSADPDAAVLLGYAYRSTRSDGPAVASQSLHLFGGLEGTLEPSDAQVARLGMAFASAPKVALLRALLREGAQSAAQLGESAGLSTGSLYHHLRELTHAEVIVAAGRNRFALTERGIQSTLILFTLAGKA